MNYILNLDRRIRMKLLDKIFKILNRTESNTNLPANQAEIILDGIGDAVPDKEYIVGVNVSNDLPQPEGEQLEVDKCLGQPPKLVHSVHSITVKLGEYQKMHTDVRQIFMDKMIGKPVLMYCPENTFNMKEAAKDDAIFYVASVDKYRKTVKLCKVGVGLDEAIARIFEKGASLSMAVIGNASRNGDYNSICLEDELACLYLSYDDKVFNTGRTRPIKIFSTIFNLSLFRATDDADLFCTKRQLINEWLKYPCAVVYDGRRDIHHDVMGYPSFHILQPVNNHVHEYSSTDILNLAVSSWYENCKPFDQSDSYLEAVFNTHPVDGELYLEKVVLRDRTTQPT